MKERLAKAVEAYCGELLKKPTMQKGLRTIAELHGVDHNTLACAVKNKRSTDEANAMKQKLTMASQLLRKMNQFFLHFVSQVKF